MKPIRSTCRRGTRMPTPMAVSVTTAPLCRSPISLASRVSLMMLRHTLLILWLVLALLAGCSRSDETGFETPATTAAGTDFLMFPNPQASLCAADYDVVITNFNFVPITYTLTVIQTSGTSQTLTGVVAAAVSIPPFFFFPGVATQSFEQTQAGGVTISLNSGGANVFLTLNNGGTTSNIASTSGINPSITLPRFAIDQAAYSNAYYTVVDSTVAKTTLT